MVNLIEIVDQYKMYFVNVVQNQLLFRKYDDAVRKLIFKDRHVTYRKIERTIDISGTSICIFNIA